MHASYLRKSFSSRLFDLVNFVFMLLLIFVMVYPFYYLFIISFNEGIDAQRGGIYFYPRKITLESYQWLFRSNDLLKGAYVSVLRVIVAVMSLPRSSWICSALRANHSRAGSGFSGLIPQR